MLYSKTILGKKFEVAVRTKCDLLIYSFDVKVNCIGRVNVKYFGQSKSIKIFDITKSVTFTWSHTKTFKDNWATKIWIGLPKTINFIGITLNI